ncbi:hypothetical protein ONE63_008454 [Megalurothrips usitatus]|uniref:J domain-containing protein n=1 Tax=Megalurothrips usitatus TaxID=439358 RepID=A0AAV7XM89_9NEOP|nr:hypothetical protein ONE63_008454 [Megalurothrips usitatus]
MLTNVCDATLRWKGLMHLSGPSLKLTRMLNSGERKGSSKQELSRCCHILKVSEDSNIDDIRTAFISLAKKYHPDSGSPDADSKKFQEVESAYRTLQAKFSEEQKDGHAVDDMHENSDVQEHDIQHTAPQHRQYLSFDGVGTGTPSQRQKQYQKQRAMVAADNVLSHRIHKLNLNCSHNKEEALAVKDKVEARKIKTRYGMDRLVEDLIQESMAKGHFDNLSGTGKPLKQGVFNPYVDFTTHKLNEVLIDNGFTPEWILLQKEIREERDELRQSLIKKRKMIGPLPLSCEDEEMWKLALESCSPLVKQINLKINKYNLLVPILEKQMLQVQLNKEAIKILEETEGVSRKVPEPPERKSNYEKHRATGIFNFIHEIFGK